MRVGLNEKAAFYGGFFIIFWCPNRGCALAIRTPITPASIVNYRIILGELLVKEKIIGYFLIFNKDFPDFLCNFFANLS